MLGCIGLMIASMAMSTGSPAHADSGLPVADPTIVADPVVQGAAPVSTDKTIPHWHGQFTDPTNGVTYGFNMAGASPSSGSDVTIPVDIIPLRYVFSGYGDATFDATDVVDHVVHSPIFQATDFSTTPAVSGPPDNTGTATPIPGGSLSAGNVGQYLDAYMRAQFNAVGSTYHLRLQLASVYPAQTIKVQKGDGGAFVNSRGVPYGYQANQSLVSLPGSLHLDPTHLELFLTDNVFFGNKSCCALGYHGTQITGGQSVAKSEGAQPTYIVASYARPGTFVPAEFPFAGDIATLTHELAEWADDPFANNAVDPWTTTQSEAVYGCQSLLEVGDPLINTQFAEPGNSYDTGAYADGMWHFQDEAFLPWMSRQAPNTTSQPTQSPSAFGGRYTFLGDLNNVADFRGPAQSCPGSST